MTLTSGIRFGAYEITGPIGAGGMGEVYRARDTRLNRDVAIKVLPDLFAGDPERLARFEREAQMLGSLNHPHIAHVYGVEESGASRGIVMELVEGEDLAQRLARGPLPLDEALPISRQIADALAAAHDAGIVHRDLKPANIKLRADGTVKVLDFGLAKAAGPAGSNVPAATITTPAMTHAGIILGTAAYMSPEQARGKPVDRRSDVWAFGCVLYEMLAGKPAFGGDTVTDVLGAIVRAEPEWTALPADTPASVRRLLARCLQKDPRRRARDMADLRLDLEEDSLREAMPPGVRRRSFRRDAAVASVAALLSPLLVYGVLRVARSGDVERPRGVVRLVLPTPNDAPPLLASVSPDGQAIALIADDRLWLQKFDSFTPIEVPGSDGAHAPFWSPDSAHFGFQARGQLWRVGRGGGAPVSMGRVPDFSFAGGVSWLPDGRLVFTSGGSELFEMPAAGGTAKPLFALDPSKEVDLHNVTATADGSALLYVVHPASGNWTIELFVVADGSRHTILSAEAGVGHPVFSPPGHVVFEQRTGVWAMPFSLRDRRATGEPFLVVPSARQPSIGGDGTLVMLPGGGPGADARLAFIDRSGKVLRTIGDARGSLFTPRISPDGRYAAVTSGVRGEADIWIYDLERASQRRLTFEAGADVMPSWSPDGQHIVYQCQSTVCARRADGSGPRVELLEAPAADAALSPDGTLLVFERSVGPGDSDLFVVGVERQGASLRAVGEPRVVIAAARVQGSPAISPDGRHIAYVSAEGGVFSVFVSQFPGGQGKWQVPLGYARWPRWSPTGDRLFVSDEIQRIIELPVDLSRSFEIGSPTARIPGNALMIGGYDRAANGTEFLVPVASTGGFAPARLLVVQNWIPEPPR